MSIKIRLTDREEITHNADGDDYYGRDLEGILKRLEQSAGLAGMTIQKETESRAGPGKREGGGWADLITHVYTIASTHTVAVGATSAAVVVFVRNLLGAITDAKKLIDPKTIEITVKGKKLKIKDGATAEEVLQDIKKALGVGEPQ